MDAALRRYVARIKQTPSLSQAEERMLVERWRGHRDVQARNRLLQAHLGFVVSIARRYERRGGSFADVIAEGNLGLLYAIDKFQPEHGTRFATYAQYWVRVYASRCAIRNGSAVPAPRSANRVRLEQERAQRLIGDGLAARELVADRLGCTVAEVEEALSVIERRNVSWEALGAERHGAADPRLFAPGPNPEQAIVDQCEQRSRREAVRSAVAALSPRERRIAERRLMAEPDAVSTLEQLGTEFGVSRERVRQLEARLKQKLAACLSPVRETFDARRVVAAAA